MFKVPKFFSITLLILFFAFIFGFISVSKLNHFQTFAWDLAFFDELIWKVSRGIEPRSSFNNLHVLGDHFQPIIILLAPLYLIKSDVRLLLVAHALIASLSVFPVYLLSQRLLKHQLLSLSISISFLFFTGFQHAVLDGFHQSVFAPLFLGWLFYFLEIKKYRWYWLSVLGLLLTKEEYALLLIALGLTFILHHKQMRLGILTSLVGVLSFFLIIYFVIPFFQKGSYTHFGYGALGNNPVEVLTNITLRPLTFFTLLISPPIKLHTLFETFFSFGFLPLLTPSLLIPVLQQFVVRFIDTVTLHRWTNLNHYAFPLSTLMSIALIYSLQKIIKKGYSPVLLSIYVLFFTFMQNILYHGPVNSLSKPQFYETQKWELDAQELIKEVPQEASVASQNSLLPHLSQRPKFYLLPEIGDAEYIAVDLADGPNKYSPIDLSRTQVLLNNLIKENNYQLIWQKNSSLLFKKTD